jgi:hypothetical protein
VDALQRRYVHEPRAVAGDQEPGRVQPLRQSQEPALRDRLRAPGDPLATFEELAHERMRLELLEHVVHRELDVAVVEPDDHPEGDHVLAHGVDEGAAELAVLRPGPQRPAHRVDHAVEGLGDLPDLLHAERPHLRVVALEREPVERDPRQVTLGPLGQHGHLRLHLVAGHEVRELLPVAPAPLVAGLDAAHSAVADEQLVPGRLRQDHRAGFLRLAGEPAAELRQRRDVVAAVAHRRRRRDAQRPLRREEVDGLVLDPPEERHLVGTHAILE